MGNLGFAELLLIGVVALLVFGPERLPELARNAGRMLHRFRTEASRSVQELKRAADIQDLDRELRGVRRDLTGIRSSLTSSITGSAAGATRVRPDDAPPPVDPEAT